MRWQQWTRLGVAFLLMGVLALSVQGQEGSPGDGAVSPGASAENGAIWAPARAVNIAAEDDDEGMCGRICVVSCETCDEVCSFMGCGNGFCLTNSYACDADLMKTCYCGDARDFLLVKPAHVISGIDSRGEGSGPVCSMRSSGPRLF